MSESVEIPDAAVEAGGRIIAEHQYQWSHLDEANRAILAKGWQSAARAVLVAASPYLGLTRQELRAEIDELIRNAYVEGWREAKQRPEVDHPVLEIDWTQPGGVHITELWCLCDVQGSSLSASCKVHGAES